MTYEEVSDLFPANKRKILIGCAPCQPYSSYAKKNGNKNEKWKLVSAFADLICTIKPDIISMENVPELATFKNGEVFGNFVKKLENVGYSVTVANPVDCRYYGIPQQRKRLVLLASKFGEINLLSPTNSPETFRTVRDAISDLERIKAGTSSLTDPIHKSRGLSEINLRRIKASVPGGTWGDWPEGLKAACHLKDSGKSYRSVYGRMEWDKPSPTITTECVGYGNGRFGHPEQDRAISLREAALFQTFPPDYEFVAPGENVTFSAVAKLIGNAVPVNLGKVIAESIKTFLEGYGNDND
jgi:DNA (cytosine-5)-methyltransferase 1